MSARHPRLLVLDTSVAIKWHLPEQLSDEAARLLEAVGESASEFLAPSTLEPEFFNALWQRRRRNEIESDELWRIWTDFRIGAPITLYDPADLIERAAELTTETGIIIYDALFVALAEHTRTVVITADSQLIQTLNGTHYASLVRALAETDSLLSEMN
jgi:predicted nucleic acid-binding protein